MTANDQDAVLMRRVANGDRAAFTALLQRYTQRLHAYAYRLLGNPSAAEDAVQDSFLRVWRQADKWRPTGTVSAWLHRIAHYICIDRLRVACPDESTEGLEVPDLRDGPEATHQQAEVGDHLNGGINRLPARQKSALLLVHFQELRGREASEILDISVEALESLLTRARRNLRDYLAHEKDALIGGSEP